MRYGSVCSGVEAASLAWEPLGWTPAWFAEVDPFCRKLLARRWPHVPNLGDITRADFAERAAALGPIDVLVGGTPCQSFSVAGKRGGLADARGNLTLRYLEILAAIRPAWLVWENVPGVLSDDGGRTFGTVLGKMANLGYRLAYRVLDAALAGVPQSRRRVFVVGHSGAGCPGEVLALAEGQGRNLAAGGESRPEAAADAGRGPAAVTTVFANMSQTLATYRKSAVAASLTADAGGGARVATLVAEAVTAVAFDSKKDGCNVSDLSPTLRAMNYSGSRANGGGQVGVVYPASPQAVSVLGTVAHTLTTRSACEEDGTGRGTPVVAYTIHGTPASEVASPTETVSALRARTPGQFENSTTTVVVEAVAFTERGRAEGQRLECQPGLAYCLTNPGAGGRSDERQVALAVADQRTGRLLPAETPPQGVRYVVRRLTPRECERLQGFPDDHTLIPVKPAGKTRRKDREYVEIDGEWWELAADGPRYRAIGNSMAVPVMRQIGERIEMVHDLTKED